MSLTDYTDKQIADSLAVIENPSRCLELYNYETTREGQAVAVKMAHRRINRTAALAMLWPFHAVRRTDIGMYDEDWDEEGEWIPYDDHAAVVASLKQDIELLRDRCSRPDYRFEMDP